MLKSLFFGGGILEAVLESCKLYYSINVHENPLTVPVLLLHGWGCDSTIFNNLSLALKAQTTVIAVDFPGHGKSDIPPVPWNVEQYASQIEALMKFLKITTVNIVAHSFGGRVAIYLASKNNIHVEKLILTGAAGIKKEASKEQVKRQKQFKTLKKMMNSIEKIPFCKTIAQKGQQFLINKYGSPDYRKLNEVMRKTFVNVINEDLTPLLPQLTCPTLLIWGENDTETPLWMGQKMESLIPDSALISFENRGHFAFLEETTRFQVITKEFFFGGNT